MRTRWQLILVGGVLISTLPGRGAGTSAAGTPLPHPLIVNNVTGSLRIQQSLPGTCDNVDQTTPVLSGRLELTPADGVDVPGGKTFTLTRANATFQAFTIHRDCMTQNVTRNYTDVGVQLARTAALTATPTAPDVYAFTIPKENLVLYEGAIVNGNPEPGYMQPKEDVTGTLDFVHNTFQMQVAVAMKIRIKFGCVPYVGCAVDSDYHGTLTATLNGTIVPPDADRDGVPDRLDNCRFVANPTQDAVATPLVTPPPDVTVSSCTPNEFGTATAVDRCDAGPVSITHDAPAAFAIGANTVTWHGVDGKGRTASSPQTVTVVDGTAPVFSSIPLDIARDNCGLVPLGKPTATDDCGGQPRFANDAPLWFRSGATVVTWTATDPAGNRATATQTVTVTDTVPPFPLCTPAGDDDDEGYYRVLSIDACLGPQTIHLGGHALKNGETIRLKVTSKPGVRLVRVRHGIKHFEVGKGEAVITAADAAGNQASATCGR